jgi:hypothetical protein
MNGPFIEDCFCLTPKWIRDNEYRIRKIGAPINPDRPDINYWFEDKTYCLQTMFITVGGSEPQAIDFVEVETPIAWREYFICPVCGERVYKLFLLPNGKEFRCRKCHHPTLKYFLTAISKKSPHGKMLYATNRMDKLSKQREKMGTILYQGEQTKKFKSFLRQCKRAGYTKVVDDAERFMEDLKTFETAQGLYKA